VKQKSETSAFLKIRGAARIWAVGSIHGELALLQNLHEALLTRWQPSDRIVYLGNYLGYGPDIAGTIDELLSMRRKLLAMPGAVPNDIVFLRGCQEEMWQKLLQLQFAANPGDVLAWMLQRGMGATLQSYGSSGEEGLAEARQGALALTHWTGNLRRAVQAREGHNALLTSLRRAAHTADESLAFVSAGLDPKVALEEQDDSLWWGHSALNGETFSYAPYRRVVRGLDRAARNMALEPTATLLTLDGGSSESGGSSRLLAACLAADGALLDQFESAKS